MRSVILDVLEELREVVGPAEARAPFDEEAYRRMVETTKRIIDDNFKDAVAKGTPELAGSWIEVLDALTAEEPQAMRDSKTPSAETMKVRKALGSEGYLFYKAPGSKFEFVYAPEQTPDHAKIAELKDMRKKVNANLKASATPDDKDTNKKALKDLDQQVKALEKSPLMQASAAATSRATPMSADPEPLKPTKEMKDLQKQIKAAEQEIAAAGTTAARTAAEKKLADLEKQLDGETATAQKAQASGAPVKKKGTAILDIEDPAFDPSHPDVPPETRARFWQRKRVGAYKNTAAALAAVDEYEKSVRGILSVLAKDPEQKKFSGDREARMVKLMKTLRDVVSSGEDALNKVGSVEQPKKVAEGLISTAVVLTALFEELKNNWLGGKFVEVEHA